MSLSIFLSHAWRDKRGAAFKRIEMMLREDGCEVWVDRREVEAGEDLGEEIIRGIDRSDLVLALWSAAYVASAVCRSEVDQALERNRPLVIVRLDDEDLTTDPRFAGRSPKYLDFRASPELALARLRQLLLRIRERGIDALRAGGAIGESLDAIDDLLAEVEDSEYRRGIGASGNEASGTYVEAMLRAGERLLGRSSALPDDEKMRIRAFLSQLRRISEAHPGRTDDDRKAMLRAAIDAADPRGQSPLLRSFAQAMDAAATDRIQGSYPDATRATVTDPLRGHIKSVLARPDALAMLHRRLDELLGSPAHPQRAAWEQALRNAIDAIPGILEGMEVAAIQSGIAHLVAPLLRQVADCFLSPDDIVPDRHGAFGLLDDAYLAHAFLYQVNLAYQMGTGRPLIHFDAGPTVQVLRHVLGPEITGRYDAWVVQAVNQAVAQARFEEMARRGGSLGGGGGRTGGPGSWGGTWEDEMARMGAELGISFD